MNLINQLLLGIIIGFFVAKIFNFINDYRLKKIAKKRELENLKLQIALKNYEKKVEIQTYYDILFLATINAIIKAKREKENIVNEK